MHRTRLNETIAMRGDLRITVYKGDTLEALRRIEIRNKITFLAADVIVELLAQRATDPNPVFDSIFSMRMGSSNTPASRADTNLGAFVVGKALADVDKITGVPGELQFLATLGTTDGNGNTMQEAGLFTRGSAGSPTPSDPPNITPGSVRMFSRQTHPAVPKTNAISIAYDWRLAFTA